MYRERIKALVPATWKALARDGQRNLALRLMKSWLRETGGNFDEWERRHLFRALRNLEIGWDAQAVTMALHAADHPDDRGPLPNFPGAEDSDSSRVLSENIKGLPDVQENDQDASG